MLDVNQDILAILGDVTKRVVENIFPFRVGKEETRVLNLRSDNPGYLELQTVEGGAIYLFRGNLSAEQCKVALEGEPNFSIAAAVGGSSTMKLEPGMGAVTLFSKVATIGFVRTCQYP